MQPPPRPPAASTAPVPRIREAFMITLPPAPPPAPSVMPSAHCDASSPLAEMLVPLDGRSSPALQTQTMPPPAPADLPPPPLADHVGKREGLAVPAVSEDHQPSYLAPPVPAHWVRERFRTPSPPFPACAPPPPPHMENCEAGSLDLANSVDSLAAGVAPADSPRLGEQPRPRALIKPAMDVFPTAQSKTAAASNSAPSSMTMDPL
mmetsp:Transcript_82010/g.265703  ORF Transcript_82010/g.265703 Transcript_82010/m.265703 type:complete len:206 (+) Transcript_82010:3526-4143(+)